MSSSNQGNLGMIMPQRKNNIRVKLFKDGYWLQQYKLHTGPSFKGMYIHYKPEDYDTAMAYHIKFKHRSKAETLIKPKPNYKLIFSKEMKVALLTISTFTEKQANKIVKEMQTNLSKDF